jgi:hypothetical protein
MGGPNFVYSLYISFDPKGNGAIYTTGRFNGTVDFDPGVETFNLSAAGDDDIFLSKLDGSGNFIWAKAIGGLNYDIGNSIFVDRAGSGDIYITGRFSDTVDFDSGPGIYNLTAAGDNDIFVSKFDDSGNLLWAKAMGGLSFDVGNSIVVDPNGSGAVYTTGRFSATVDFDPGHDIYNLTSVGSSDIFISKLDGAGNFVWAKTMGGINLDIGLSSAVDAKGYVHTAGTFSSPAIPFSLDTLINANNNGRSLDIYIAKLDVTIPSLVEDSKASPIHIFPNPTTDQLTISFNNDKLFNLHIAIYNIIGEVVFSNSDVQIDQKKIVDLSQLTNGIYFMQLQMNGISVMKKVVKE